MIVIVTGSRYRKDLCIAFPTGTERDESKGTWDCVDQARRAGIPVEVIQ